jgi:hypothetical protein
VRHTHFRIRNFRGIEDLSLDLTKAPRANVYTLIGLNESGKTTILEAINLFSSRRDLDPLKLPGSSVRDIHELIPIGKRSNFNGEIAVEVGFECDKDDEVAIAKYAKENFQFALSQKVGRFEIEQSYTFKDSKVLEDQPAHLWSITLRSKPKGKKRPREVPSESDEWQRLTDFIADRLPTVRFFPNFLFDLPDRIYLESPPSDPQKHEFYKTVLQDVLDAIGEQANLRDHVLTRAQSGSEPEKRSMESVLLKVGSHITQTVFSSWNKIFNRAAGNKEISVNMAHDPQHGWYLQLRLKEGSNLYSISERSLGFRWFFAFLLLTQYRGFRKGAARDVLFLFDEPASNLHPSAQAQLLESFGRFPSHAPIVYTTHSHHMVNPDWLEGTFVVKNEGMEYSADDDEFIARDSHITLHRYRTFAAAHPNQTTYFQPVLDVLAYQPNRLENVPAVIMTEGKNDFYTLRFVQRLLKLPAPIYMLPGSGAGSLADVIRLYLGWGRDFVVLLDSDTEGHHQKLRYEELFGRLVEGRIITLADVSAEWEEQSLEALFDDDDRTRLQQAVHADVASYQKTLFNRALQELLITGATPDISAASRSRFTILLKALQQRLVGAPAG